MRGAAGTLLTDACRGPEPLNNLRKPLPKAMSFKNKIALLPRSERGPCTRVLSSILARWAHPPLGSASSQRWPRETARGTASLTKQKPAAHFAPFFIYIYIIYI